MSPSVNKDVSLMTYVDYLDLEQVLHAQHPRSQAHDEMLFIIQHQTSELWLKLAIHELTAAMALLQQDKLEPCFKMLSRVARIFDQLNSAWDVLRTMTPSEYTEFREALGGSSGFQSWQYRAVEFVVGNKNAAMLTRQHFTPEQQQSLTTLLQRRSIYDETIHLLARRGLPINDAVLNRDVTQPYQDDDSVRIAWKVIYTQADKWWSLYELAEKLVDFEDYFRRWRFNHVTTVERIIGMKAGTGGTSGSGYLRKRLETVLFPELWQVRTEL